MKNSDILIAPLHPAPGAPPSRLEPETSGFSEQDISVFANLNDSELNELASFRSERNKRTILHRIVLTTMPSSIVKPVKDLFFYKCELLFQKWRVSLNEEDACKLTRRLLDNKNIRFINELIKVVRKVEKQELKIPGCERYFFEHTGMINAFLRDRRNLQRLRELGIDEPSVAEMKAFIELFPQPVPGKSNPRAPHLEQGFARGASSDHDRRMQLQFEVQKVEREKQILQLEARNKQAQLERAEAESRGSIHVLEQALAKAQAESMQHAREKEKLQLEMGALLRKNQMLKEQCADLQAREQQAGTAIPEITQHLYHAIEALQQVSGVIGSRLSTSTVSLGGASSKGMFAKRPASPDAGYSQAKFQSMEADRASEDMRDNPGLEKASGLNS